jgi:hypothetical protein
LNVDVQNPRLKDVDSSPTPGALLADPTNYLKYPNRQNKNIHLKYASAEISPTPGQTANGELKEKILLICKDQKHYVQKMLNDLLEKSKENALIISDYIS